MMYCNTVEGCILLCGAFDPVEPIVLSLMTTFADASMSDYVARHQNVKERCGLIDCVRIARIL